MMPDRLPTPPTPFIGRTEELTKITNFLTSPFCRLLTLVGPGGIGKTRLAIEAARLLASDYSQNVYFVSLVSLREPADLVTVIGAAIGLQFSPTGNPKEQILNTLRNRLLLLVLDNFEHLLDGTTFILDLIQGTANIKIMITSRERLNVQSEIVFHVGGMDYPHDEQPNNAIDYGAVKLLLDHFHHIQPELVLTDKNLTDAVRICRQVQGMPLALILAAAWLNVLTLTEIADEIARSFDILETTIRDIPWRHHSIHAVFDPSWQMLSKKERVVFKRLSVFRGGFSREAAEEIAGASLNILATLVNKSLVVHEITGRYELHELLRQYGADKLTEADEADATYERHLAYYLRLAEEAEVNIYGRDEVAWCDRLESELDNFRAALTWTIQTKKSDIGLRLVAALGWFFHNRSHLIEGLAWFEQMLAANSNAAPFIRAKVLWLAGEIVAHPQQTRAFCEEALSLARLVDDWLSIAWSLSALGYYGERKANPGKAIELLGESIRIFRTIANPMGLNHALRRLANIYIDQGDYEPALVLLEEALSDARQAGDKNSIAYALRIMGSIAWHHDHLLRAKICFSDSQSIFKEARNPLGTATSLNLLALAEIESGNDQCAQNLLKEALNLAHRFGLYNTVLINLNLAAMSSLVRRAGELQAAATLLAVAEESIKTLSRNFPIVKVYERELTFVRNQLSESAFTEAWHFGNAMSQEQALDYGLQLLTSLEKTNLRQLPDIAISTTVDPVLSMTLSAREHEVMRLIAQGLTNAEIAQYLSISVGTVKVHVRHIYDKLDVSNRTQAVAVAHNIAIL